MGRSADTSAPSSRRISIAELSLDEGRGASERAEDGGRNPLEQKYPWPSLVILAEASLFSVRPAQTASHPPRQGKKVTSEALFHFFPSSDVLTYG